MDLGPFHKRTIVENGLGAGKWDFRELSNDREISTSELAIVVGVEQDSSPTSSKTPCRIS